MSSLDLALATYRVDAERPLENIHLLAESNDWNNALMPYETLANRWLYMRSRITHCQIQVNISN